MPQDPLTQLMTQRAMMANQPQAPLPGTLSPQDQAGQDSAPLSFLGKPLESGMDFGLSAAGLRDQEPGNLPQMLGAAVGAGAGGLSANMLRTLGAVPEEATGLGDIGTALIKHLLKVKPEKPRTLFSAGLGNIGGPVPPPNRFDNMLRGTIKRVPEAANFEVPATLMKRPEGLPAKYAREAAFRTRLKPSTEDAFETAKTLGKYDRNSIRSLDEIQDIPRAPTGAEPQAPAPKTSGVSKNGAHNSLGLKQLAKYGMSEDDVRNIRSMGLQAAQEKYPHINKITLNGIVRKDSFGWIR